MIIKNMAVKKKVLKNKNLSRFRLGKTLNVFFATLRKPMSKNLIIINTAICLISVIIGGLIVGTLFYFRIEARLSELKSKISEQKIIEYQSQTSQEKKIVSVIQEVSPAVVSIIVSKDLPVFEEEYYNPFEEFEEFFGEPFGFEIPEYRQKGTEKKEIGWGTGFIVSSDGLILTNKHVVSDEEAEYTALTNDGNKYKVQVLVRDKFQDLAILKIEREEPFKSVKLGDSSKLQIGQTVIAIGNALGEFRNTVSVGVISGLGRTITASGGGLVEILEDVIQTDAAINRGNSGGPLLNLKGEVIGINVATAQNAQNIGFSISINKAKIDLEKFEKFGKIVYPYLGIWYWNITSELQKEMDISVSQGAWITKWNKDQYNQWYKMENPAVIPDTAASKAGLKEEDIILEFDGKIIAPENSLAKIIRKYNPEDKITLKVLREGKEFSIEVTLGERE